MKRGLFVACLAACAALLGASGTAAAQSGFPSRPIELVVPFGVGGSTDIVARVLGELVSKDLGQPVVVVNKGGAGGAIALDYVKRAKPDGHTLALFTASGATVTPHMQPVGYDAIKDFAPIMNFGGYTTYLTVAADSPFKTLDDMTAFAAENPDQLVIAVTTLGAVNHLGAARLMDEKGVQVEYVPFGSGGQIIAALLGGHVRAASVSGEIAPMVNDGKLRALVSFTREQLPAMADVPSIQEQGSEWELDSWLGIAAPAGLPDSVRDHLEASFIKAAQDAEFLRIMNEMAMIVSVGGADELAQRLATSYEDNGRVIRELGLGQQ